MNAMVFQNDFFRRLGNANRIDRLLDRATGVYFFIKDRDGRIVAANQLTIERCGCREECELIGKTDYDFFPYDLADKYVHDDQRVMETETPIENMSELAPNDTGALDCYITNKMPLYDKHGKVIGIAGTTISHDVSLEHLQAYSEIAGAVRYIIEHFARKIEIPSLAQQAGLPPRRFSEQFKRSMKYTPQTFVVLVRIHYASLDLIHTDLPIAQIAERVGFYDHSVFTRQFKKHRGVLPAVYRARYGSLPK